MNDSPPLIHRLQRKRSEKFREGTVLSFTVLHHPPKNFGRGPRRIGLVELSDGSRVLAPLLANSPRIGQRVVPRMRLQRVSPEGLRIYDVAYEGVAGAHKAAPPPRSAVEVFPRYILALTGPSGVGKSTVSRLLGHALSAYIVRIPIVTTRQRKSGDDGEYRYVSKRKFQSLRMRGDIVTATMIPSDSEERLYGYLAHDIEAVWKASKLPVVVTEMHLLQGLAEHYGRRAVLSFGLLPPGRSRRTKLSHLLYRLRSRGRDTEEQIRERLLIAKEDLRFFEERRDLFDDLFVNEDLDAVVDLITKAVSCSCPEALLPLPKNFHDFNL